MAFRFVEALQLAERHGEVDEGVVRTRSLRHRDAPGRHCFVEAVLRDQRLGKIQVRANGCGIALDDVLEERHLVAVDPGLPPRQRTEHQQHGDAADGASSTPRVRQPACSDGGGGDRHRHCADAREVLIAVRHEGEQHVGVIDEAEGRRQGDDEEERPGEGTSADAAAQPPQRPGHHQPGDQWQPRSRVAGLDIPARVDDRQVGPATPACRRRTRLRAKRSRVARLGNSRNEAGVLAVTSSRSSATIAAATTKNGVSPRDIRQADPTTAPPVQDHQRRWQGDDHVLR